MAANNLVAVLLSMMTASTILTGCASPVGANPKPNSMDARVTELIDYLATWPQEKYRSTDAWASEEHKKTPDKRREAMLDLIALGKPAVPCIVKHLDDGRGFKHGSVWLNNKPGSFEGWSLRYASSLTDALGAALWNMTGQSFGGMFGDPARVNRSEAIREWRTYVTEVFLKENPDIPNCK